MADKIQTASFRAPLTEQMLDSSGLLSRVWQNFFLKFVPVMSFIGQEKEFVLANNQAVAANVTGLVFDKSYTSQVVIDYCIQRLTSTTEVIQSGTKHAVYKPGAATWSLLEYGTPGPDASGITFSITSAGQIKYTSSNLGGTQSISRIFYRVRELAGKHTLYSKVG